MAEKQTESKLTRRKDQKKNVSLMSGKYLMILVNLHLLSNLIRFRRFLHFSFSVSFWFNSFWTLQIANWQVQWWMNDHYYYLMRRTFPSGINNVLRKTPTKWNLLASIQLGYLANWSRNIRISINSFYFN